MKKKLLSFAVAFMLLLQTFASAGDLYDLMQEGNVAGLPFYDANNRFSWTLFVDQDSSGKTGGVVTAKATGAVAATGSSSFASSTTYAAFDYKLSIDMTNVKNTFNDLYGYTTTALAGSPTLLTMFDDSAVKGNFTIVVTYDAGITPPSVAPTSLALKQNGAAASAIYSINAASSINTTSRTITIIVDANTTVGALKADITLLDDLSVTLTGWTSAVHGAKVSATMTGSTIIEEPAIPGSISKEYAIIDYQSPQSDVTVYKEESHSHSGGGGGTIVTPPDNPTNPENPVDPDGNDVDGEYDDEGRFTPDPEAQPKKKGKIPNGYGIKKPAVPDPNYNPGDPIDGNVNPGDTLYPRYVNGEIPERLRKSGKDGEEDNEHYAYIAGYPDGEVKPNNNITREEVTAAFYRLLNDEYRAEIETSEQDFPDVEAERWSNESIATMANGGYIVGDTDGNFNPGTPITRAEFAVIASKFIPADTDSIENSFIDIDGHWAKDYILAVAGECWIYGYEDERFNPDAYITRAEAMTIINRMLVRYGDVDSSYAIQWPDVSKSDWYYQSIIEATTDHKYERKENGWSETWIEK